MTSYFSAPPFRLFLRQEIKWKKTLESPSALENTGFFRVVAIITYGHTCATHMLEAGVPMMAIKNFLGHSSVMTTERYAALSQATVNSHIREWNDKWFHDTLPANASTTSKDPMPDFLR